MLLHFIGTCYTAVNTQVASGGKVHMKPRGYNHSHIPKALEHTTGLLNLQPSHELPMSGPLQASITPKPDGLVEKKNAEKRWGGKGGNAKNH